MAQKANATENLAQVIIDSISKIAIEKRDKSPHDKTFSAVILGVDRKFTDRVSVGDREEIIEKFGIPEAVENGGNYYTFRIDGAYYVKRSVFPFKLYDEIRVRVPNGNWSNMFIENGVKEDAFVPEVIYSQTEPTAEEYTLRVGDIWIKTDENGSLVSVYEYRTAESGEDEETVYEWTLKTSVPAVIYSANEPTERSYALNTGDIWIETDNDTDKKAKAVYEYVINDDTAEVPEYEWQIRAVIPAGSGVGENVGEHNERFNDYENNIITGGDYNHVDGENNSITNSYHTSVSGELNEILNSEASAVFGYHNKTWGGENGYLKYSVISGYWNGATRVENSFMYGIANHMTDVSNTLTGGQHNVLYNTDSSLVCGQWNRIFEAQSCMIAGDYHAIPEREGFKYTGLIVGGFSSDVTAFAYDNHIPLLVIGNGDYAQTQAKSNALRLTSDGNLIIQGTLYPGGADYAETYEWLDGNPESEDRRGLFVTLSGDKIIKADESSEYVLGVISSSPTVCGDTYNDHWKGKFKKDVFGSILYDEKGHMLISEEFDPDKKYIPQSARPEKAYVGTHGKLVVTDDGTCVPNKYCKPSAGGIGTYSEDVHCYRVLERIDKNHVRVVIK